MLINPSSKRILTNYGDRPPLGLLYLGAVMKKKGHHIRIRDMDHYSKESLIKEIDDNPPDYAGVSVYTSPLFQEGVDLANLLRGKCKTIAGGYHATALPETLNEFFDTIVVGEGEIALPQIVENDIKGIVVGEKMDINQIPHPARELVDMNLYDFKQDDKPATTMVSSRGCPMDCVFCGNINKKMRFRDDDTVIEEIRSLKKMGFHDLYFFDDVFTVNKKRTMQLIDKMGHEKINYRVTTRAKSLDDELVKKLKDSGCSWVSLGIESGSDTVLKSINKYMTTHDNLKAVDLLRRHDIKVKGFFIFGLPHETEADAMKTIEFAKKLKQNGLTNADFYIMTPFPGTKLWKSPEQHGIEITDRDFTKYLEAGKVAPQAFHRTKFMTEKQIESVRNLAEKEWKSN